MKEKSTGMFAARGASRLRRGLAAGAATALGLSLFAGVVSTGVSGASSLPANVVAAQAALAKLEVEPSSLPKLPVITKPIPKNLLIVDIACGNVGACADEPAITQQATNYLHWRLKIISTDGTAGATANAWTSALRLKPFAIIYQAAPKSEFASQLAQAKKDGIHVATCCTTDPVGADGIMYNINDAAQSGGVGVAIADWMVANSTDGAPHALYVNLPEFPILTNAYEALQGAFATDAPNGQLYTFNEPLSDLGSQQGLTDIVNYLTAHPDITEVSDATDGQFIGLPAALSAAGLTNVQVFGEGPTSINAAYIEAGTQSGSVAFDYYEDMFAEVDALARAAAGVKVLPSFTPPLWVLDKQNLPAAALTGTGIFPVVANSPKLFEKLWK